MTDELKRAEEEAELWKQAFYSLQGDFVELKEIYMNLGEYERKVLLGVGARLVKGQIQYGSLVSPDKDGRCWLQEASEEALDGCVYLALQLLSIKDEK